MVLRRLELGPAALLTSGPSWPHAWRSSIGHRDKHLDGHLEDTGIKAASFLAFRARPSFGHEVRIIDRKRSVRQMKIHILFDPGSKKAGGEQMRFFVLPVLWPAVLIGFGLARLR